MHNLTILPDGRTITIAPQETILAAAIKAGISHAHACGGAARCSTCRVWVLEGIDACAPRTPREAELAERLGLTLSCGWPAKRRLRAISRCAAWCWTRPI
ncbi:MAG: (2Fe-2S)-binding protein [Alphaproteobacteria bacterium]|nr:(2Fe-2S)-binding protein [Alphaproteobacteria bacterium]